MQAQVQQSRGGNPVAGDRWIDVAWRHRASILALTFAGLVLSVVGAFLWPDTFRSTASLKIKTADSANLNERVRTLATRIESPVTLQALIDTYDLYPTERKRLPPEDVAEHLRQKVSLSNVATFSGTSGTFQISFDYGDRFKAQKVVQDLAVRFMYAKAPGSEEHVGAPASPRSDLTDQVASITKDLEAATAKVDEYRAAHDGMLPDQADANQLKLSELQTRRTRVQSSISRAKTEQLDLETRLASEVEKRRNIKEYVDVPAAPRVENKQVADLNKQIQAIETRIKTLKEQYTEKYPDVIDARQHLGALQAQRDALVKQDAANAPAGPTRKADLEAQRAGAEIDANISSIQTQIAAKNVAVGDLTKELAEVDDDIQGMIARFKDLPAGLKEYNDLLQDRDLKQTQLDEAQIKLKAAQESQPASGEAAVAQTIEQVDPASLPLRPISPHRALIVAAGVLIGLLSGLVLASTREISLLDPAAGVAAETGRGKSFWIAWSLAITAGVAAMAWAVAHHYLSNY